MTRMMRTSRDITTAMMTPEPLELFGTVDGPVAVGGGSVVVRATTNKH